MIKKILATVVIVSSFTIGELAQTANINEIMPTKNPELCSQNLQQIGILTQVADNLCFNATDGERWCRSGLAPVQHSALLLRDYCANASEAKAYCMVAMGAAVGESGLFSRNDCEGVTVGDTICMVEFFKKNPDTKVVRFARDACLVGK